MTRPNTSTDTPAETTVADELAALKRITGQLDSLDPATRRRTLRWLTERYGTEDHQIHGEVAG